MDGMGILSAEESPYNTAVFITHLHLDHMAYIGTVAPEIPVYMHRNAQIIERALEDTGEGVDTLPRGYTDLVPDVPVRVGNIEVYPLLTRGESYCDFSFFITTPDGTFHWTGDLCLHGEDRDLTLKQMEFVKSRQVDVLLCDCTSFMDNVMEMMYSTLDASAILPDARLPAGMLSEADYNAGLFDTIGKINGLGVFNYYQREMSQAERFMEWAGKTGRVCAFEPDAAYIIYRFFGTKPNVYVPDSRRYPANPAAQSAWYKELLQNCHIVTREDIRRRPGQYLIQNSYRHILELLDLPCGGGAYLHADGIPIGAFDPAYPTLRKLVALSGFKYTTFFCENYFGHGYPGQVKYFVDQINPKVLIPCHSYNPERLLPKDGRQLLPELNRKYLLENHNLVLASEDKER
jgi:ribonuclease J